MATFRFRNNSKTSPIPVSVVTASGGVTRYILSKEEIKELTGVSLTHETQVIVDKKYVTLLDEAPAEAAETPTSTGLPMVWSGDWVAGQYYNSGCVVAYEGQNYVVVVTHKSQTNPSVDTTNYTVLSIESPDTFFGISPASWNQHELLVKTDTGWEAKKITDDNIGSVSIDAITNLRTELNSKLGSSDSIPTPVDSDDPVNKGYLDSNFLAKSGGAMTGLITGSHGLLPASGGTVTGNIVLTVTPSLDGHLINKTYGDSRYLPKTGGAMTGPITLPSSDPTANEHAAKKAYVDEKSAEWLEGGTMTGPLTLSGAPTNSLHAVTKSYVDTEFLDKSSGGTVTGNVNFTGTLSRGGSDVVTVASLEAAMGDVFEDGAEFESAVFSGTAVFQEDATFEADIIANNIEVDTISSSTAEVEDISVSGVFDFNGTTFDLNGNTIENLGNASATGDAVSLGFADDTYLRLDGSNPMEGELLLQSSSVGTSGLREDPDSGQILFKGAKVVTRNKVKRISSDYIVEEDVGLILVYAGASSMVTVYLQNPSNQSDVIVKKIGGSGLVVVAVRDNRNQINLEGITISSSLYVNEFSASMTTLTDVGESATFAPYFESEVAEGSVGSDTEKMRDSASWHLISRTKPEVSEDFYQVEVDNVVSYVAVSDTVLSSTNSSGLILFPVVDDTKYKSGDLVHVTASGYDKYVRVSTVSTSVVILDTPYVALTNATMSLGYRTVDIQAYNANNASLELTQVTDLGGGSIQLHVSGVTLGDLLDEGDLVYVRGHDGYNNDVKVDSVSTSTITVTMAFSTSSVTDTIIEFVSRETPTEPLCIGLSITNDVDNPLPVIQELISHSSTGGGANTSFVVQDATAFSDSDIVSLFEVVSTSYLESFNVVTVDSENQLTLDADYAVYSPESGKLLRSTGNIITTVGNTIAKSTKNTHMVLKTSADGTATIRVSGQEDVHLKPFSVTKRVVPLETYEATISTSFGNVTSASATQLNFDTAGMYLAVLPGDTAFWDGTIGGNDGTVVTRASNYITSIPHTHPGTGRVYSVTRGADVVAFVRTPSTERITSGCLVRIITDAPLSPQRNFTAEVVTVVPGVGFTILGSFVGISDSEVACTVTIESIAKIDLTP